MRGVELGAFGVAEQAVEAARDVADVEGYRRQVEGAGVYLGIGEKSAYLAFGKDSLGLLKSILDKGPASDSVTPMPPVQLNVALSPIMQFASSMNPGDQSVQMISTLLASSQGKDHIRLTAHTIENGVLYRLAVEEGVLKIIGPLAMSGHGPAARRPRGAGNAPGNPAP